MILTVLLVYGGALALLLLWSLQRGPRRRVDDRSARQDSPAAANDNALIPGSLSELTSDAAVRLRRQGAWDPPDPAA